MPFDPRMLQGIMGGAQGLMNRPQMMNRPQGMMPGMGAPPMGRPQMMPPQAGPADAMQRERIRPRRPEQLY
jgi:hypothetical protein